MVLCCNWKFLLNQDLTLLVPDGQICIRGWNWEDVGLVLLIDFVYWLVNITRLILFQQDMDSLFPLIKQLLQSGVHPQLLQTSLPSLKLFYPKSTPGVTLNIPDLTHIRLWMKCTLHLWTSQQSVLTVSCAHQQKGSNPVKQIPITYQQRG